MKLNNIIKIYEDQRNEMPISSKRPNTQNFFSLNTVIDKYEYFLFDAYGVLNLGNNPINGAREILSKIKSQNKSFLILTNGATYPTSKKLETFKKWNFPIQNEEIISSRDALKSFLSVNNKNNYWGVIGNSDSDLNELSIKGDIILDTKMNFDQFDEFIFLGSGKWNENLQKELINSMKRKKRKILVANPDLVAPLGDQFSLEPGYWSWEVKKETNCEIQFFGKPYKSIFNLAFDKIIKKSKDINLNKILMVGDTLHTDILGGQSFGVHTALIKDYGLFANEEVEKYIMDTKIYPDLLISKL